MEEEILALNEDMNGDFTFDQSINLEEDTELYMSRPYSSLFEFERGVANLVTHEHYGYFLEELDKEEIDYAEIYR